MCYVCIIYLKRLIWYVSLSPRKSWNPKIVISWRSYVYYYIPFWFISLYIFLYFFAFVFCKHCRIELPSARSSSNTYHCAKKSKQWFRKRPRVVISTFDRCTHNIFGSHQTFILPGQRNPSTLHDIHNIFDNRSDTQHSRSKAVCNFFWYVSQFCICKNYRRWKRERTLINCIIIIRLIYFQLCPFQRSLSLKSKLLENPRFLPYSYAETRIFGIFTVARNCWLKNWFLFLAMNQ